MRHRRSTWKLGRDTQHRKALFRNLARALILEPKGRIITTEPKAKGSVPFIHRLVTFARRGDDHSRRLAYAMLPDLAALNRLFAEVGPAMKDRPGGYTRIHHLGAEMGKYRARRQGDDARRVLLAWTDAPGVPKAEEAGEKKEPKKGLLKRLKEKATGGKKKAAASGKGKG